MITDNTDDFEKIENEVNRNEKLSILNKLLSQTFDKKLTELESNTNEHFAVISSGINLTNLVCSLCTNISKRIKPKLEMPIAKRGFTPSRNSYGNKNNLSYLNKTRPKTPLKRISTSKSMSKLIKTPAKEKSLIISKTNGSLLKSKSRTPSRALSKSKFSYTNITTNTSSNNLMTTIKNSNNTSFYSTNVNKSMMNKSLNISNPSLHKIYKQTDNNKNEKPIGLKRITLTKEQIPEPEENITNNNIEIPNNMLKISEMESNMQDHHHIKHEDALLVTQSNDLDFVQLNKFKDVDELIRNKYKQTIHFNIPEFIKQHFSLFILYLNQHEIFQLMFVNKLFFNQVTNKLISTLEEKKKNYENKILEYKDEIIENPENQILKASKGTMKATDLLNGPLLNKIFTEINNIPNNDILRIYCLYFQVINHKNAKNYPWNKAVFWENTCNYFMKENNGKTGQLLAKNVKEDIDLSDENLYYIIKILDGHIDKIHPGYFSKICGTTGLFAFLIKDVLDYFGLSNDKNIYKKRYWMHKKMVDVLERKIDKIKAILK